MRPTTRLLIPALMLTTWVAMPAMSQDKAKPAAADKPKAAAEGKAGQGTRKTFVDNDKVTVVEARYKPGEASDMRKRGPRVTRALTSGEMERVYADGKKEVEHWKAGDVKYLPEGTFINKNIGKTEVVLFVVTLK
jgi:hypothetical protein